MFVLVSMHKYFHYVRLKRRHFGFFDKWHKIIFLVGEFQYVLSVVYHHFVG
ncbi:hypothetical protein Tsp_04056, partial [Trichinella spiralis]|uniref:hypothetical protein n=1 Tax=Trichinella spiralis TaxID=6334 RepID=UPI0001EFD0DC